MSCALLLILRLEPAHLERAFFEVFCGAGIDAIPPHSVARGRYLLLHQRFGLLLGQSILMLNGFKGCTIFPRHLDNARDVG